MRDSYRSLPMFRRTCHPSMLRKLQSSLSLTSQSKYTLTLAWITNLITRLKHPTLYTSYTRVVSTIFDVYKVAFIDPPAGSTGLPKPIYQPQKSCIANYAIHMDMKAFITLPLYHNHGICNFFRAIYSGKSIHIYNADLPLTQQYLTSILRKHVFEIFYGVPYALKLLAETDEGIALLRQLKIVMYGGSACPDTLGTLLVDNGVKLVGHYGAYVLFITSEIDVLTQTQHRGRSVDDILPARRRHSLELRSRITKTSAFPEMDSARSKFIRMHCVAWMAIQGGGQSTGW